MTTTRLLIAAGTLCMLAACGGSSSINGGGPGSPPGGPGDPGGPGAGQGEIRVLSNRADLISGGDALVEVVPGSPEQLDGARVLLGNTDISDQLVRTDEGTLKGLIEGLALGPNTLRVVLGDNRQLQQEIINHPHGGPVFSGPQVQPWRCTNANAVDAQCNQPPEYSFKYVPADRLQTLLTSFDPSDPGLPDSLLPYDPENPPPASDIAVITTDHGVEVPFIVRQERGVQNRDRYLIMTLFQPGEPWNALAPQPQWNRKLLIHHGGNVGVSYGMGNPPEGDIAGTAPDGAEVLLGDSITTALARGFMTLSTAQGNLGHNANLVTAAESLMMAKERIIEQYGEIRYTIGTGCSGGSITQQHVANAYPGIYQGLIVQCSYPDVWTTATQFADYNLLSNYFGLQVPEGPEGVPDLLRNALAGDVSLLQWGAFYGHLPLNPVVSDLAFFPSAAPDQENCRGLQEGVQVYDPDTAPDGLRCGLLDYMINQFGPRPPEVWTPNEALLSRGFAGIPLDNVGVQYGLNALNLGLITPDQFLAVNREIGGLSVDIRPQPERTRADMATLRNAYRTGAINTAEHLANVPIIDLRGPDPGIAHDAFHSWQMRARLEATQGHADNHVIWYGPAPLFGDTVFTTEALLVMDLWLSEMEQDDREVDIAQRVVDNKPTFARDRCLSVSGLLGGPDGPIVPLTGNLLYPDPLLPFLDLSLLPSAPAELGVIADALTGQACGLDVDTLPVVNDLPVVSDLIGLIRGVLSPILDPVLNVVATTQQTVVQTRFGTPRTVAGDDIRTLTNKCQLKPIDPADYPPLVATSSFLQQVAEIFPEGVCDYSQPGEGVLPTETWLHYGDSEQVIFGGEPLDASRAEGSRQGWASPAFDVGL